METIVSSYLAKKLPSGSKKSLSDGLETASRVQGLLSDDIVFEKTGPQTDPWLKTMESMQTADHTNDHTKNGTVEKVSLGFSGGLQQKGQKRLSDQEPAGFQVILRNCGSRGQVGLTNVGNTCYFNSMLQCLMNCKPFYNYIRSEAHDKNACRRGDNCVLCLLKNFSVNYLQVDPPQKIINGLVLRDLLVKMRTAVRRWKIHSQQSADEILSYVMDSMWEREMQYYALKQNQTPMFNIFGTVIEQQYACSLCGKASIVKMVEPTIILGLVNGDRRSVQDRLRVEYGLAETLSEPKDKCHGCGRSRTPRPTMKRVLEELPMVLVVMLKRFYVIDGISHKINQFVQFPETLDLRPCMDPMSKGQNSLYKLTGVVEHWGKSVTDGHYVAYCKNYCNVRKTEGWFYLNDTLVRPIDLKEVLQKNAYVIFYAVQGQTNRTVKLPPKVTNGTLVSPPNCASALQPKARKISSEACASVLSSPTSKSHSNGISKAASKKVDFEPPRFEPPVVDEQPGCSGYSNGFKNDLQPKQQLSNGSETDVVQSAPVKVSAGSTLGPSAGPSTSALPDSATAEEAEAEDEFSNAESHKDGTARSKSFSLLMDCNGNSHRKHGEKSAKKYIFTNSGSKLILLKTLPPDQAEVQKSLVPYESSEEDDDEQEEVVTNKIVIPQSVLLNGSRFSSSLTWVIDKFNDAPSGNSNSSQNSNVHGTSPGWKVSSTDASRASSPHNSLPSAQIGHIKGTAKAYQSPKEKVLTVSYCPKLPAPLQKEALRRKEEQRSKSQVTVGPVVASSSSFRSYGARGHHHHHHHHQQQQQQQQQVTQGNKCAYVDVTSTSEHRLHSGEKSMNGVNSHCEASSNGDKSETDWPRTGKENGFSYWGASLDSTKPRAERDEYDDSLDRGRQKKIKHRHPWKGGDRKAENPFQREQDMRYKANGGGSVLHRKSFKDSKQSSRFKSHFRKWGNNNNDNSNNNGSSNHRQNGKQHWRFHLKGRYGKNQGYKR